MRLILTTLIGLLILLVNEAWWRIKRPNDEISRKAVHIILGCFVAFWPYYLSWLDIELLGVAVFISIYISKHVKYFSSHFKLFKGMRDVRRTTWGEFFFAISVTLIALITHDKLIYTIAILSMGLADGLASIFGTYFGKRTNYKIFNSTKSLVGSLAFFITMIILLSIYHTHASHPSNLLFLLVLALTATALENISILGLDNLFVPLLIAVALR
jgi:phytol kinase